MSPLQITLLKGHRLADVPIAVEVVGSDLETKWKGAIALGESALISDLAAGHYSIQASLPSGRKLTQAFDLYEGKTEYVEMNVLGDSPREGLEWVKLAKPHALENAERREELPRSVWCRLWRRARDGRWGVQPWPVRPADRSPGFVQYEFHFRSKGQFGQYYLQVGGPTMQWRLVTLPADDICVLITGSGAGEPRDEADSLLDISVTSRQHDAEVLLGHLSRGEIDNAGLISQHLVAGELLHGKRKNPTAAAIAGYFLLETGELKDLHQVWVSNLAEGITWLPDGAVIDAWYSMRRKSPDFARARRRLIEAVARGMPVYTRGLRLLLDGLALFEDDPEHRGPDVSAALKSARRYAAAADWRSTITTFIGEDPESPGKTALGKPGDSAHVVFLSDLDAGDLEWKRRRGVGRRSSARGDSPEGTPGKYTIDSEAVGEVGANASVELAVPGQAAEATEVARAREKAISVTGGALRRYREQEQERQGQFGEVRSDTPERRIARFFRAADAQTQGERMFESRPVNLAPDSDEPAELHGLALERIIGATDMLSVCFLERGVAAARTVGHLVARTPEGRVLGSATGFMVSPRLLLTNWHVMPTPEAVRESYVEFDYQDGPCGRLLQRSRFSFDPDTFFVSNEELDFSLIMVRDFKGADDFGWNRLTDEQGKILVGERLSVIQHSKGAPKQVSIRDNQLIDIVGDFLHYQSDAAAPWSGAPLFNDQWEVIGIHHASIPAVDSEGNLLANDGAILNEKWSGTEVKLVAHEGVRASSIVRFLRAAPLTGAQAELRDELLFSKPPAARRTSG